MMQMVGTTGATTHAMFQPKYHHQQTNTQFFYRLHALPVAEPTRSDHCLSVFVLTVMQRMMEVVVITGAINRATLQSIHHHQQTNTQSFYRPDALPVTQPTMSSTEGKISHYPKLTLGLPTLSLTTKKYAKLIQCNFLELASSAVCSSLCHRSYCLCS